jgi:broad specificity phosphatase PhoE
MLRVFVVRHAQSRANLDARLSSAEPGPELTDLGHQQAQRVAEALVGRGVERIYSSPLLRTMSTAGHIGNRLGLEVGILPDLREFGLGDWEGRPGTDRDVVEHPVFASWLRRELLAERFQGGESAHEVEDRFERALDRVRSDLADGSAVVVTHGGLMALAVPALARVQDAEARIPDNAETWTLTLDGGRWQLDATDLGS